MKRRWWGFASNTRSNKSDKNIRDLDKGVQKTFDQDELRREVLNIQEE
jgi:hypothetical protein